jgi:hypothetical protein
MMIRAPKAKRTPKGTTSAPERRLAKLAAQIRKGHELALTSCQTTLKHAIRVGRLLLEAKAATEHGQWLPWLDQNCPDIGERTAQNYMRLAANPQQVADSASVREALASLAVPMVVRVRAEEQPPTEIVVGSVEYVEQSPRGPRSVNVIDAQELSSRRVLTDPTSPHWGLMQELRRSLEAFVDRALEQGASPTEVAALLTVMAKVVERREH